MKKIILMLCNVMFVCQFAYSQMNAANVCVGSYHGTFTTRYCNLEQVMNDSIDMDTNYTSVNSRARYFDSSGRNYFSNHSILKILALRSRCLALKVAPSNKLVAYCLLDGEVRRGTESENTWRLARGCLSVTWSWTDETEVIPSFTPNISSYKYSDMVIDPKNADRIFVSYSGVLNGIPNTHRVHVSSDGGNTFTNMSQGLKARSVNCLAYQEGSDDVLYAGTDDGAYYWDTQQSCWISMGNLAGYDVIQISIDKKCGTLLVSTNGKGIWEAPLFLP